MGNVFAGHNIGLIRSFVGAVAVSEGNVFDLGTGISARQDQRNLNDVAVLDISATLGELVSENRHGVHIAVLQKLLCVSCCRSFVEETISVNAFGTILELDMTKHVFEICVTVLPDQGDNISVVIGEGVVPDGPAITASNIVLGGPT